MSWEGGRGGINPFLPIEAERSEVRAGPGCSPGWLCCDKLAARSSALVGSRSNCAGLRSHLPGPVFPFAGHLLSGPSLRPSPPTCELFPVGNAARRPYAGLCGQKGAGRGAARLGEERRGGSAEREGARRRPRCACPLGAGEARRGRRHGGYLRRAGGRPRCARPHGHSLTPQCPHGRTPAPQCLHSHIC